MLMKENAQALWSRRRARGRTHFVLRWGLLFWGGLMFVLMGLAFPAATRGSEALTLEWVLFSALLWACGGLVFGFTTWYFSERAYRASIDASGSPTP